MDDRRRTVRDHATTTTTDATAPAPSPLWPRLAASGITGFVIAALCVHGLRPDLDPVDSQMSLYLVGPWGPLLQAGYVALSLAMLALAAGLYHAVPRAARSAAPASMLALSAICLAVTAYAHMDMRAGERSLHGLVHGISAQGAFLFATTGLVLQALRLRCAARWQRAARWLLPWALACFAAVWVLALWHALPRGLAQKAVIALIIGWLAAACALLWRRARPVGHNG